MSDVLDVKHACAEGDSGGRTYRHSVSGGINRARPVGIMAAGNKHCFHVKTRNLPNWGYHVMVYPGE